jgi:hypothetical protein
VFLCLAYWWALPKPIPGIPYNKQAIKSLLGDIRPMLKHIAETQEVHDWMSAQNVKLNSPIVQLFIRPFGRPCVVITDFLEAQDILVYRTKEFDRSKIIADVSGGIVSKSHYVMQTNDEFKKHRKWVHGIMASGCMALWQVDSFKTSLLLICPMLARTCYSSGSKRRDLQRVEPSTRQRVFIVLL